MQFTKAIFKNKTIQLRVNTLMKIKVFKTVTPYSGYSMESTKAKVRLKYGFTVTVLLDTIVEINVITKVLMEDTNLAIRQKPKLELVSYKSHSRFFPSLYEDIEIAIEEFKTKHLIFVIEVRDYDLILGRSVLSLVKFS